jgi:hypothetical protein
MALSNTERQRRWRERHRDVPRTSAAAANELIALRARVAELEAQGQAAGPQLPPAQAEIDALLKLVAELAQRVDEEGWGDIRHIERTPDVRATEINLLFDRADRTCGRVTVQRVEAGKKLNAALEAVGQEEWRAWCKTHVDRSLRDISRAMFTAGAEDPTGELSAWQTTPSDEERDELDGTPDFAAIRARVVELEAALAARPAAAPERQWPPFQITADFPEDEDGYIVGDGPSEEVGLAEISLLNHHTPEALRFLADLVDKYGPEFAAACRRHAAYTEAREAHAKKETAALRAATRATRAARKRHQLPRGGT